MKTRWLIIFFCLIGGASAQEAAQKTNEATACSDVALRRYAITSTTATPADLAHAAFLKCGEMWVAIVKSIASTSPQRAAAYDDFKRDYERDAVVKVFDARAEAAGK